MLIYDNLCQARYDGMDVLGSGFALYVVQLTTKLGQFWVQNLNGDLGDALGVSLHQTESQIPS